MRSQITIIVTAIITVIITSSVFAQSKTGLLSSQVINIAQDVPVAVDVVLADEDGNRIEASVPITVGVYLAVKIDGAKATLVETDDPQVSVESEVFEKASQSRIQSGEVAGLRDVEYTVIAKDGIEIVEVNGASQFGQVTITPIIRNGRDTILEQPTSIMSVFGEDGELLNVVQIGFSDSRALAPEAETGITLALSQPDGKVTKVLIQITGEFQK